MVMKIFFFALFLMVLPVVFADNQTHETVTLTAPENHTILYNDTGTNDTHLFPIACLDVSVPDVVCSVDRTLGFGETYTKDENSCDLKFTCPSCEEVRFENVTYRTRWRIETTDDTFTITYLNNDENRTFTKSGLFDLETEFKVQCPEHGDSDDDEPVTPLNITDSEFLTFCLQPFGKYGDQLTTINNQYLTSISSKDETIGSLSSSNTNLAGDLGSCEQQLNGYDELVTEHEEVADNLQVCELQLSETKEELAVKQNRSTWLVIHLIIDALVLFVFANIKLYKKHTKGEDS